MNIKPKFQGVVFHIKKEGKDESLSHINIFQRKIENLSKFYGRDYNGTSLNEDDAFVIIENKHRERIDSGHLVQNDAHIKAITTYARTALAQMNFKPQTQNNVFNVLQRQFSAFFRDVKKDSISNNDMWERIEDIEGTTLDWLTSNSHRGVRPPNATWRRFSSRNLGGWSVIAPGQLSSNKMTMNYGKTRNHFGI